MVSVLSEIGNSILRQAARLAGLVVLLSLSFSTGAAYSQKRNTSPNIILVMVDDLGYSDFGVYGSEIETPTIDALAREGVRFRQFYNNAMCAVTRATLLTGQYQHKAGIGYWVNTNLGLPAYQGWLNRESLTLGEVLQKGGYKTYLSGKWHVGQHPEHWPLQRGFDRFFGFVSGASNFFDSHPFKELNGKVALIEDSVEVYLKPGEYLTDKLTDKAIEYLEDAGGHPFFIYLAYNAPHWPLQAPEETIDKYRGKYKAGWDILRVQRIERQKLLGIAVEGQEGHGRDPEVVPWNSITYDEQELWQRKMEVYAAMVDRVDQNLARVLEALQKRKIADNTVILLLSDNGAQGGFAGTARPRQRSGGPIGSPGSYDYQEQNWAWLSNTPLRNYKASPYEGGISSPFIAWYPAEFQKGVIHDGKAHIMDLAPTIYDLAGVNYPQSLNGIKSNELAGVSLRELLTNGVALPGDRPLFWERAGNRAARAGKWKLVSTYPENNWQLYDIEKDRGENRDLAAEFPEKVRELDGLYQQWAKQNGVKEYDKVKPRIGGLGGNASGERRGGQL